LSIHGSNLNSIFEIKNELKFLLLIGILIQNFNTEDFVKFLEKKSKTSHPDRNDHIEDDIMQNHEQKKKWKKWKSQGCMGKKKFFLNTLPFNPWAVLATWLHVGAPQKIQEKWT
jgi:hypothetical protein